MFVNIGVDLRKERFEAVEPFDYKQPVPIFFQVLPIVIFFSTIVSMLYYLGVMQSLIKFIASGMQVLMGTTAGESLNAAGNIFIGQVLTMVTNSLVFQSSHHIFSMMFLKNVGFE